MERNEKDTSWEVIVRKCIQGTMGQSQDKLLTIPQTDLCVNMPGFAKPLGRPIDADLSVQFIYNFIHHYRLIYRRGGHHDFDEMLDSLSTTELKDLIREGKDFHEKLGNLNYAMSIDKNMVLKTLSQPGCEGLRFYLCARPNDNGSYDISLVTVGIDCEGYDLNYRQNDTVVYNSDSKTDGIIPHQEGTKSIKTIEMRSLTGEYVTPPFGIIFEKAASQNKENKILDQNFPEDDFNNRFILLNIAMGLPPFGSPADK